VSNFEERFHSNKMKKRIRFLVFIAICITVPVFLYSQVSVPNDSISVYTIDQCIHYAMDHHPGLNQAYLNSRIVSTTNAINLSGWLPQVNVIGNGLHYIQLPTTLTANSANPGGTLIATKTGIVNTVTPQLSVSETIFSPQLLFAATTAHLYSRQASENIDSSKIFIVTAVSKSFYNLLFTLEQITVLQEDTARLSQNVNDAYNQYVGGIVDETDYQQAMITLNNSKAQLRQQIENVAPEYASLKQLMGYPPEKQFNVVFDTLQMEHEIAFDTTQPLLYENRIEYRQLQTAKDILHHQTLSNVFSFFPTISAVYSYNYEYETDASSDYFKNVYPYSYVGLSLNFPIFTGFSRIENLHRSKLQEEIADWSEVNLKAQLYTEYTLALANYKSNLSNWQLMNDNQERAKNVYRVVSLQYKQGVVPYLNIIVAESNLITAEIGSLDALFQLLSSKIDLEKALGKISYP